MSFTLTSKNIALNNYVLRAECLKGDGKTWSTSTLHLGYALTNEGGAFMVAAAGIPLLPSFSKNLRLVDGRFLHAELDEKPDILELSRINFLKFSDNRRFVKSVINLDVCISNKNGELTALSVHKSIRVSCCLFTLKGTVLSGLCLGRDGRFHVSSINLNDYFGNRNGCFDAGDKHFASTATEIRLETSNGRCVLHARLRDYKKNYKDTEYELDKCIENLNGRLHFEKHDGFFHRDGALASFLEPLPVLGYVVAVINVVTGNPDHALRAAALCSNSTIVAGATIIGGYIGGSLGSAIAAGLSTPIAILAETAFSSDVRDPRLKEAFREATLERYLTDTFINTLSTGAGSYFAQNVSKALCRKLATQLVLGKTSTKLVDFTAGKTSIAVGKVSKATLTDVDNDLKQALGGGRTEEDLADSAADQAYYLIRICLENATKGITIDDAKIEERMQAKAHELGLVWEAPKSS